MKILANGQQISCSSSPLIISGSLERAGGRRLTTTVPSLVHVTSFPRLALEALPQMLVLAFLLQGPLFSLSVTSHSSWASGPQFSGPWALGSLRDSRVLAVAGNPLSKQPQASSPPLMIVLFPRRVEGCMK